MTNWRSRAPIWSHRMADASKIGDLLATGGDLLAQAYRRGYRDGVASAKARIVSSLSALDEVDHPAETSPQDSATPPKNGGVQSPHGPVRPIVLRILSEHPGCTVAEPQSYAPQINAKASPPSSAGAPPGSPS